MRHKVASGATSGGPPLPSYQSESIQVACASKLIKSMVSKFSLLSLGSNSAGKVFQIFSRQMTCVKDATVAKSACDKMNAKNTNLVWMDLELTGLDVQKDKILEVSCIITDKDLNIQTEGLNFAISHPEEVYEQMNDWCKEHHFKSGLVDACRKSSVTPETAEELILSFLKQKIPQKKCALAGNSVYMDRLFLYKFMPSVNNYLHYRIVDVSTLKELASRWHPEIIANAPLKTFAHRSLDDIKESIEELKFYKQNLFK